MCMYTTEVRVCKVAQKWQERVLFISNLFANFVGSSAKAYFHSSIYRSAMISPFGNSYGHRYGNFSFKPQIVFGVWYSFCEHFWERFPSCFHLTRTFFCLTESATTCPAEIFREFRISCVHLRREREALDALEGKEVAWRFLCKLCRERWGTSDFLQGFRFRCR